MKAQRIARISAQRVMLRLDYILACRPWHAVAFSRNRQLAVLGKRPVSVLGTCAGFFRSVGSDFRNQPPNINFDLASHLC
jgi:hypothetical protein